MIQKQKLNIHIDSDGEFEVVLRKEAVGTIYCSEGCCFKSKETGELFGSPLVVKDYRHDKDGNLLDLPEKNILDDYEVIPYD